MNVARDRARSRRGPAGRSSRRRAADARDEHRGAGHRRADRRAGLPARRSTAASRPSSWASPACGASALDVDLARARAAARRSAYTGASRNSGINNWDVMVRRINGDAEVVAGVRRHSRRRAGLRERARARATGPAVARHLAAEWDAPQAARAGRDDAGDRRAARRARSAAGALAGKVCGAGGGGCLFCLVDPDRRAAVAAALAAGGAHACCPSRSRPTGLTLAQS